MKKLSSYFVLAGLCWVSNLRIWSQEFYDLQSIQTIRVYFHQSNWDQLMDAAAATTGDYIQADSVVINDQKFETVGVKFKGNSSYNANQAKNPWHIELDTYIEQDYQGFKDIKLANIYKDPSFIRDVLGFQIARQYMDAPFSNFANLYVNDVLIGLYANTEAISKNFIDDRFGSNDNTFFNCSPPAGAGPSSTNLPNLAYLGADSSAYYAAYEIKSDTGWKDLIALCDTLNNNTVSIESILDVDRALWMLAFDNAIVNLDSYIGQFKQNYYLYQDDFERFLSVVWDLNESFGVFSATGSGNLNSTSSKMQMDHLLHSTDANHPLVSKLLAVPTYKRMYLAHLKTIMLENFTQNGNYLTMAQSIRSTIDAAVQADPNKFYTYAQFNSNLTTDVSGSGPGPGGGTAPGLTSLMDGRFNYLMNLSDFTATQPVISNIQVLNNQITIGTSVQIQASVSNANLVQLKYRSIHGAPFQTVQMFDDGLHNDGAANDQVFGASIDISQIVTEYYIYAENNTIGRFSPERAQHEFYLLNATGDIIPSDLVINEFMASNTTSVADQDGEFDDWIELYNNSSSPIDISGFGLSDNLTELQLFTFPQGTTIQPDTYVIIWADRDLTQSGFHADFKLSASGETIYLTDVNMNFIDSVAFGPQEVDQSFGRYPNGNGPFQVLPFTFGAENTLSGPSSIIELSPSSDIDCYPNPVQDLLNVKLGDSINLIGEVVLLDLKGKVVYRTNPAKMIQIPVVNFTPGIYLLKIGDRVKKVVIQ